MQTRDGQNLAASYLTFPRRHFGFIREDGYWESLRPPIDSLSRTYLKFERDEGIDWFSTWRKIEMWIKRVGCSNQTLANDSEWNTFGAPIKRSTALGVRNGYRPLRASILICLSRWQTSERKSMLQAGHTKTLICCKSFQKRVLQEDHRTWCRIFLWKHLKHHTKSPMICRRKKNIDIL